jgi:Ca2+-binding RTX toxin-like protein
VLLSSEVTISYTNGFGSSVELDTAKAGATIQDNGSNDFVNVVAGSGADTLIGPNVSTIWGVTGVNQGTLPNLAFRGVANLVGGTDNDTFAFSDGARVTGRIDGGTGNNALDFARYTTDVTANLSLGKSTGAGGGIVHINDVTGGQANDILVGDDSDNVLIGGPGRNILIAGQGSDTLNASSGGLGEDILIGGQTTFDGSTSALNLIKAEWTRPDTLLSNYKTRVDHLMNGGGLNGLIRLNATTVFADGSRDLVNTSATAGLDLLGLDNNDLLSRRLKPSEQVIRV